MNLISKYKRPFLALALIAALAVPMAATAQVTPTRTGNAFSNVVGIAHTTSSNLVSTLPSPIPLTTGKSLTLSPYYAGAQSTNTGVIGFGIALSTDNGSNYTTTTPLWITTTGNGAAAVRDFATIPATSLGAATHAKIITVTNAVAQKGTVTITNVYWGIEN